MLRIKIEIFVEMYAMNWILSFLAKVPVEPECRIDENCPSQHACINERCQNPCRVNNPCIAGQECVVQDTLPTRTIACICPDGFLVGDNGECNKGILFSSFKFYKVHWKCY